MKTLFLAIFVCTLVGSNRLPKQDVIVRSYNTGVHTDCEGQFLAATNKDTLEITVFDNKYYIYSDTTLVIP